jgi:phosphatidate cytidylyltransferase
MPEPDDERKEKPEDLFTDLDKFFAPIEEEDWPEEEPAEESARADKVPDEGEAALEDWTGPTIEIPDEEELLGPGAGAPPPAEGPAGVPPARPEPPGEGETVVIPEAEQEEPSAPEATTEQPPMEESTVEPPGAEAPSVTAGPPGVSARPGEEWLPDASEEMSGEEWERFRQALEEEAVRPEESAAEEPVIEMEPAGAEERVPTEEPKETPAVDERPVAGEVEAAAEHFAESIRQTPEDVERELLADLEAPVEEPGTVRVGAEVPVERPPTWEEPAIGVAEEAEAGPPPPGRNLPAALISGGLLAFAALALLAIGKAPFVALVIAVIVLGQGELYAVLKVRGAQPATALGLISGAIILAGAYNRGEAAVLFGVFLAMALAVPWYMAASPKVRRGTVMNVGATLLGVVYVPVLASFALIILRIPGDTGRNLLLTVLGLTVLYDVCAYAIGSLWGNRPLAPTISPKKSWEGAVGATFVLLLVALAIVPSIEPFTAARAVGLALVIAVAAPVGDLVESALKRDLGLKDMGSLLPGHGGVLDRVDSILFAAPAAWYFMRLVIL